MKMQGLAIVRPIIFERPNARSFSFSSYTHKNLVLTVLIWDTVPLCVIWSDLSLNFVLSHQPMLQIWSHFVVGCPICFWSDFFMSTSSQKIVSTKKQLRARKRIFLNNFFLLLLLYNFCKNFFYFNYNYLFFQLN